jgi:cytochrome c oxidase cbb3-type subunit I/II
MWVAGITQWGMWRAFEPDGRLVYPDFIETVIRIVPMYWVRLVAALLFFSGLLLLVWNVVKTIRTAPANYAEEPEVSVPPLVRERPAPGAVTPADTYDHALYRLQHEIRHGIHRALEARSISFTVLVVLALAVGSLVEAIPMFFNKENVKEIASVKPLTPLEVTGRDIYIREGCYNCHSQLVRPFRFETERYGEYSKAGEYVYDHPFQWGSKRTGPDLHRVGGKYPSLWHVRHMAVPASTTPGSVMPRYPHLLADQYDTTLIGAKLRALRAVGVPYTDGEIETATASMQAQARAIAAEVEAQQGPRGLVDKEIMALAAYLQRLGTDIRWKRPQPQVPAFAPAPGAPAAAAGQTLPAAAAPAAPAAPPAAAIPQPAALAAAGAR